MGARVTAAGRLGRRAVVVLVATAVAVLPFIAGNAIRGHATARAGPTPERAAFGKQPLSFIENRGQVDRRVAYYARAGAASLFFTDRGVTFALTRTGSKPKAWAVEQEFLGRRPHAVPQAGQPVRGVVNSFRGPRSKWQRGLKAYGRLVYRDVWPGIDAVYSGMGRGLEYSFVIRPRADPRSIALAYRGAQAVKLTHSGRLAVSTPVGDFAERRPIAYQQVNGRRVLVRTGFDLGVHGGRRASDGRYGFRLGAYDRSRPVVIDPVVFGYAGFLGGSGNDQAFDTAVDKAGNAYVAGSTSSPDFPATPGALSRPRGETDAFVAKVDPAGTELLYAGYIGGTDGEGGRDISVDADGNAYVAGTTSTTDGTFPAKVGPDLTYGGGNHDGFVAKVDKSGRGLVYCSFIGGDGQEDNVRGTAPDASGNVYITGHADSSQATFPVTVGPDLTYNGNNDGYVGKINRDGTAFTYLGYVGGSSIEQPRRVAVDGAGNAYITGSTGSTDFPVTVGPDLSFNGSPRDAFVTKVNSSGTGLVYSGFIGGAADDQVYALDVDAGGSAYVAGLTTSTQATFPVSRGPDVTYNGGQDGFVAKVNTAGTGLDYAGYIGGDGADIAQGVGVDSAGAAYVSGGTTSRATTFPTLGPPDSSYNGGQSDVFLAQVAPVRGAHITVSVDGPVHAGIAFTVTSVMRDGAGRPVTAYSAPANWTSASRGISPNAPADFVNGVSTTQATIAAPSSNDQIAVSSGGASGQSAPFDVLGPLHHIAMSGVPASVAAGQNFTVRATAKDALNDTITDYAALATWSDRSGTLAPAAPSNFVNGTSTTVAHVGIPYHDDQITLSSNAVAGKSAQFNVVSP